MITKYDRFINEKMELIIEGLISGSGDLTLKLREISNNNENEYRIREISKKLVKLIEDRYSEVSNSLIKQNYFDTTDKEDTLSFIQNNKIPEDWDEQEDSSLPYNMAGRNEMKIGRVIKYLSKFIYLSPPITPKEIETFVNIYKATSVNNEIKFKLVSGNKIADYYKEEKYFSKYGTLGTSCMRNEGKKVFKLYTKNPDKVKLLIYVDDNDEIHGRAVVWKLDKSPCDAQYFMDRIYTNRTSDEIKFKNYAREKGWMYKKLVSYQLSTNVNFIYNGESVNGEIQVELNGNFNKYPFVDTLCFLNDSDDLVSNIPSRGNTMLHSTDGDYESCSECDGDLVYSYDDTLCEECGAGHMALKELGIKTEFNDLGNS